MYIVTGGAGFIGSALVWALNQHGINDILIVDNLGRSEKWQNLVKLSYSDYMSREKFYELISQDKLPKNIEGIVHLGACSSTTEVDSSFLMENNFHYSRDLCRVAIQHGIRIIIASSAATYGDGSLGFSDDLALLSKLRPLNMYGYSKHLLDLWLVREKLEKQVLTLKFFNVYGPNEYHKGNMRSVVAKAYDQIRQTGVLELFESTVAGVAHGEQKRDFVYVKDCVKFMVWLLEHKEINGIHNVGTGTAASFNTLAASIFKALDLQCKIKYIPMPKELVAKYQSYTCADMRWLAPLKCPVHFRDVEMGVQDYVQNYLAQADPYL
ncbi:MAG: ADP-glyceromanno-heptose 6-epimerase [Desulfovibrionaceae bacterium]|nr:ADP-glyceromanno-heptose 6-epimerase [Desulfovibrionaceae bacterium]